MSLLDSLLPGNRRVLVNGIGVAQGRDTLEIECIGATITDDPGRQLTRIGLPASGNGPTEWTQFVPIVTASGGGFSLGNGEIDAWFRQTSTDHIEIAFGLDVGSTTNFGAGTLQVDFSPATPLIIDASKLPLGTLPFYTVALTDLSTPANNRGGIVGQANDTTLIVFPFGVANAITATVPFTWANGDGIRFSVSVPACENPV